MLAALDACQSAKLGRAVQQATECPACPCGIYLVKILRQMHEIHLGVKEKYMVAHIHTQ